MNLWQILILAVIQGVTEFLPISSNAHLRIVPAFLGWEDPGAAVTAILQLGSLAALIFYFRKECAGLLRDGVGVLRGKNSPGPTRNLFWAVVVGTIPIAVFGVLLRHWIKDEARSLWIIAASLIGVALVLWIAEKRASQRREENGIQILDGLLLGFAQSLALVPGVSRSGISIAAGLFLGFGRSSSARISFLLGIPALFAAGVFELWEIRSELSSAHASILGLGTLVAALVSYLALDGLIRFLQNRTNLIFIVYRIFLGLLIIFLLGMGMLQ